jgi:pimeloyl-ACP methyl ester carboxylesterase
MHMTQRIELSSVQRDNVKIGFNYTGHADAQHALIMLHGLASNASRWCEYMQHSKLNSTFHLIAMDLRGHGRSLTFKPFQRNDWVKDVRFLIDKHEHAVILAGHSMGAQIALDYASQYSADENNKLAGLVLIDPIFPQALDGTLRRVSHIRPLIKWTSIILRAFYTIGLRQRHYSYRDLYALDQETREFLRTNPHKSIADLYINPFADLPYIPLANYLQDLYEVTRPLKPLQNVQVPVLVLLSEGASTSKVEQNKQILKDIPDLEIKTIDADHWLLTEKPREAREAIDLWCMKVAGL